MVWKVKGNGSPVIDVWESYNGDLYFVTEYLEEGEIFCYVRLYSMPDCAEWGYSNINSLKETYGKHKIWKVVEENWPNLNTYEPGLFEEV